MWVFEERLELTSEKVLFIGAPDLLRLDAVGLRWGKVDSAVFCIATT